MKELVDGVFAREGRVDNMFNNAGIALFGEVRDMSADQWERILRMNLCGVVHGVVSAYPRMIEQGFRHIVNTASLAGLTPVAGGTTYVMTKHAVVGPSTSPRGEAATHGVRVSVVCPGLISTPL